MSIKLIEDLVNINAISGHEKDVKSYMLDNMPKGMIINDNLGSFLVKYDLEKPGKVACVVAHMDEVGFLVKSIDENGFIRLINVGGILVETIISQQVEVKTKNGNILTGVILGQSPHIKKDATQEIGDLYVDFGFDSKQDALDSGIYIAQAVSYKNNFVKLANNKISSKALDNRLGCAAVIEISNRLSEIGYGTIYLGASVQEEVGLRGAQTILSNVEEDIDNILVIDVSPVDDYENKESCKISGGALIRMKDPRVVMSHTQNEKIKSIAIENDIKYQQYFSKGGTDAVMLQVAKSGHETAAICIANRNTHSNNSVASIDDYNSCVDLSVKYLHEILKG